MISKLLRRRSAAIAAVAGLSTGLLGASTAFAAEELQATIDPTFVMIMPGLIIVAFIGEMAILIFKRSDDFS